MKLAILGATGQTGQSLVAQALEAGHQVVAVVRTPSKLEIKNDNLTVVQGDVFSDDELGRHRNEVKTQCLRHKWERPKKYF